MRSTIRVGCIFCFVTLLIMTGCSREDGGTNTGMTSSQQPATPAPSPAQRQAGPVVIQSVGGNVDNAVYEAALADPRRPVEEVSRDAGRKPIEVLKFFGIRPGLRVVDVGSGDGYFTRIISGIVGNNGSVVANNSGRRSSEEFQAQYREQYSSYNNVELNFENPEDISLPDNSVDVVLLSLTVHHWHFDEESGEFVPPAAIQRYENIHRMLKPGGIFAVIDHAAAPGASRRYSDEIHRIPGPVAVEDITLAGFVLEGESNIHAYNYDDDVTVRWTGEPRNATKRIVHKYRKP
jgi:predicted methyltransferase